MFLATLVEAKQMTGWRIHAYVLMRNHYHLLLQTPEANLVAGMKWFQGSYTQRFNAVHHTRGHLYQGRYKANPVQFGKGNLEYFRTVSSYIHLNPFRAHLCGMGYDQPLESYLWSSYPAYIGLCKKPPWLQCSQVYRTHGLPASGRDAQRGYQAILQKKMKGGGHPAELEEEEKVLKQIRRGWYLGDERFRDGLLTQLADKESGDNFRGEVKRLHDEHGAEDLLKAILTELKLTEKELCGLNNTDGVKQAVAWCLNQNTAMTLTWIADRLNMGHRSNASRNVSAFAKSSDTESLVMKERMHVLTG